MIESEPTDRYLRQISLPEIGPAGQRRLAGASVLVVGAGGLGSPLLFALAGAGIGRIGICDPDQVSITNLNRQFLYTPEDIGKAKLDQAIRRLRAFNPNIDWQALPGALDDQTAREWISQYDLAVSAVDNRRTRLLLNQVCCSLGTRLIDGGVRGFTGYLLSVDPGRSACYSCIFGPQAADRQEHVESGESAGTLGATAGLIGNLEASLVIRLLLGLPDPLDGQLLLYDGAGCRFDRVATRRSESCPACGYLLNEKAQGGRS